MNTTVQEPIADKKAIKLFDVGCLLNLKISTWSGRKMLTRSDLTTLGYDPDKLPDDIVNLGRKLMVPKTELQQMTQMEQRGRKALERWSVPFGIANAHFVPTKMLPTVTQQLGELQTEFFERVDSFISRFDTLSGKVKEEHPDFWEKCLKGHYPSNPQTLRERFHFEWYTFQIAGMDSIESVTVDEMVAKQVVQDEHANELRTKMQSEVGEFVGEYVTSMREETVRFCDLMTARINGEPFGDEEDSKNLTPKSISCFRNYVDRFMSMNIFGDKEVEKMLRDFRDTFLDSGVTVRDFESSDIKKSVSNALEVIRQKAAAEGESGSKFIGELKRTVIL